MEDKVDLSYFNAKNIQFLILKFEKCIEIDKLDPIFKHNNKVFVSEPLLPEHYLLSLNPINKNKAYFMYNKDYRRNSYIYPK